MHAPSVHQPVVLDVASLALAQGGHEDLVQPTAPDLDVVPLSQGPIRHRKLADLLGQFGGVAVVIEEKVPVWGIFYIFLKTVKMSIVDNSVCKTFKLFNNFSFYKLCCLKKIICVREQKQ